MDLQAMQGNRGGRMEVSQTSVVPLYPARMFESVHCAAIYLKD